MMIIKRWRSGQLLRKNPLLTRRIGKEGSYVKKMRLLLVLCIVFVLALMGTASAVGYYNQLDNEACIDWLEDARAKAPGEVVNFLGNTTKTYIPHPLLNDFPAKTALVYRSEGIYGGQTGGRNNTSVMMFVEKPFQSTDEAYAYLADLGLIEMIDSVIGTITVVTPADGKAFGEADLANYYNLHDAIYNMRTSERTEDGKTLYHADSEYYGAYGKVYFIGIDGGASFINNYIAPGRTDCIGRVAGMLLVGGDMAEDVIVSNYVPVYLLNGSEKALAAYRLVNGTDVYTVEGGLETFYNEDAPLRRVISAKDDASRMADYVADAFYNLFMNAQRLMVTSSNPGTPAPNAYLDYVAAPAFNKYALSNRNAIIHGVTREGNVHVTFTKEDTLSQYRTTADDYLERWYEIIPEDVINGTAPDASVPLILALHGTGDDPLMYADEIGMLEVAGKEGVAVVAPYTENLLIVIGFDEAGNFKVFEGICKEALPALVEHMLAKYPALDPARVYVTGYSMGGGSTYRAVYGGLSMFAAAVPMAGMHDGMIYHTTPEEDAALDPFDMPTMIMTSTYDLGYDRTAAHVTNNTLFTVDQYLTVNNMPVVEYDFEAYPMIGIPSDRIRVDLIGGEWRTFRWEMDNAEGIPMVAVSCTENLTHSLYPGYGEIAWSWMKNYSRDLETGAVVYAPVK